jgi:hypothetical protein
MRKELSGKRINIYSFNVVFAVKKTNYLNFALQIAVVLSFINFGFKR